jgi:hypothetical protein
MCLHQIENNISELLRNIYQVQLELEGLPGEPLLDGGAGELAKRIQEGIYQFGTHLQELVGMRKGMDEILPYIIQAVKKHCNDDLEIDLIAGLLQKRLEKAQALFDMGSENLSVEMYYCTALNSALYFSRHSNTQKKLADSFEEDGLDNAFDDQLNVDHPILLQGQVDELTDDDFIQTLSKAQNMDIMASHFSELINARMLGQQENLAIGVLDNTNAAVFSFVEKNALYVRMVYDSLPLAVIDDDQKRNIGQIAGPIETLYKVDVDGLTMRLRLCQINADNQDLMQLLRGEIQFEPDTYIEKYVDIEKLEVKDLTHDQLKTLLQKQIDKSQDDPVKKDLAETAQNVLREAEKIKNDPDAKVATETVKEVLLDTLKLVHEPSMQRANDYYKKAQQTQRRPWGKFLGGAMLVLAGVAAITVSIGAAVLSHGALAPVAIFGSAVGVGLIAAGIGMFKSGLQKKPMREQMEQLAQKSKPDNR